MIKKILVYITLGLIFFGLIQYCAYSVDKARAEKRERSRKLEAGVCEFDKID